MCPKGARSSGSRGCGGLDRYAHTHHLLLPTVFAGVSVVSAACGTQGPVIIGGIGDSGTRGVAKILSHGLQFEMCPRTPPLGPSIDGFRATLPFYEVVAVTGGVLLYKHRKRMRML